MKILMGAVDGTASIAAAVVPSYFSQPVKQVTVQNVIHATSVKMRKTPAYQIQVNNTPCL